MNYIASITSQGQLTIPKPILAAFGIKGKAKAKIIKVGDKIELKPYVPRDIFSLYGIIQNNPVVKANRGKPIQQIIEEETAAYHQAVVDDYKRQLRQK